MSEHVRVALFLGYDGEILEGVVEGDELEEISGLDSMLKGGRRLARKRKLSEVKLLPFGISRKVVGIGRNYAGHVKELKNELPKEPILLCKVPSSLIGHGEPIVLPKASREVHHEAELAVVIGKRLRRAGEKECAAEIAGVTCLNDVTARDLQRADVQWTRAKGFDTFCPIGPSGTDGLDRIDLRVVCRVNGQAKKADWTQHQIVTAPNLRA